jgi:hypothetical protein
MEIQQFRNSFDGDSLLIGPGASLDQVPSPFAELLTDEIRTAFTRSSEYFATLATHCTIATMKTWLQRLADAEDCFVEINTSRWNTAVIVKVAGFQLSLRQDVNLPPPGKSLSELYSLISGTWDFGFPRSGGLHEPRTVEYYGLTICSEIDIPDDAVAFFTTLSGDSLLALDDAAYWYCHEDGTVVRAGATQDALSTYFQHLMHGTADEFGFPY